MADSMNSLAAPVMNGQLIQNTTTQSSSGTGTNDTKKTGSEMDKDSFLQLLVAQMKYQDPMEPTSNTEYISQYAQFSELEAMNNLSSNMDLQRATSLVGKEVIVKSTGASGETVYTQGKVDYVSSEGTKAYLTVDGKKFSIDDLDSVIDPEYSNAVGLADDFTLSLNKLPSLQGLTPEYKSVIDNLKDVYNDMTPYQKNYLSQDTVDKFNLYVERMNQLVPATDTDNTTE
ncbi:MAG: flagellar hook capping protein [Butyrivibrio sp.]|nr:flagellar hook capping protein [Butyrivibrio sp.]